MLVGNDTSPTVCLDLDLKRGYPPLDDLSSVNLLFLMDSSRRSPIILGSGSGGHVSSSSLRREVGSARAQVEALAVGLPVIGTHEGATTTLVRDGVERLIVDGSEPEDIARAMIRVAKDRALNHRMGEAARRKAGEGNS
jgi:glycosyltransferase involved in cell wall biosynthesis